MRRPSSARSRWVSASPGSVKRRAGRSRRRRPSCAQYRLRAIEAGDAGGDVELLARYAEVRDLGAFLQAWARANPALAERRGIAVGNGRAAASTPRKQRQAQASRSPRRSDPKVVYRIRVTLLDLEPSVWRCIEVPVAYSFWDLHVAIQDAMGWQDCHLHCFAVLDPKTGEEVQIGIPDEDAFVGDRPSRAGWDVPLTEWLRLRGDRALYTCDYGDNWTHDIEVESIAASNPRVEYPRCADGARACPPEDCGGVGGYEDLLRVLADPGHEEHAAMLEWLGGSHDPVAFSPAAVRFDDPQVRFKRAFGSRRRR
jgi:hypothetical protein